MRLWISKYALSEGITAVDGMEIHGGGQYAGNGKLFVRLGKEAHETLEDAKDAAEAMRRRRIISLRKQIERLEAMKF